MYNIVSIDFDVIMAPSISLYNNMVGPGRWENDFMNDPQLSLSYADLTHYQRLVQWLLSVVPSMDYTNIHFIYDHEKLLNYLPDDESDYIITNIDHHHDILYEEAHKNVPITKENLTCGNWIKYIADNKNLVRYHWVCNGNSQPPMEDQKNLMTTQTDFREFNFNNLATPNCLVICMSPMWVPPRFRPLFFSLMDLCNFLKGYHYEIEE